MKSLRSKPSPASTAVVTISLQQAFGSILKEHRLRKAMTQDDVAAISNLDRTYISLLERGLRAPTLPVFLSIAHALELSPIHLLEQVLARTTK